MHALLFSAIRATCQAHLILHDSSSRIIIIENTINPKAPHYVIFSSLLLLPPYFPPKAKHLSQHPSLERQALNVPGRFVNTWKCTAQSATQGIVRCLEHGAVILLLLLLSSSSLSLSLLLSAIGLSPGGSGYFTCIQNMKLVTNKFKSGGLHEKHVVATWNLGNHLSVCL